MNSVVDYKDQNESEQELTMFYCSRAKPKEYVGAASQIIVPGCIVRLKHQFEVTRKEESYQLDCANTDATPRSYARMW